MHRVALRQSESLVRLLHPSLAIVSLSDVRARGPPCTTPAVAGSAALQGNLRAGTAGALLEEAARLERELVQARSALTPRLLHTLLLQVNLPSFRYIAMYWILIYYLSMY